MDITQLKEAAWAIREALLPEFDQEMASTRKTLERVPDELLAVFDKNTADARAAIAGASDEELGKPWSPLQNGQSMMTLPKVAVLRSVVMSHLIHHRAQLGLYLRLNDVPVPSIYGPSADENPMGM